MRATKVRTAVDTAIRIANLRFAYPDGVQALRGVDLTIAAGEKVALVGPNGAGKTTLLLHLNGTLRGKGDIRIMGHLLNGGNMKRVRSQVGLVFENPDDQLFSPTVFDDVAFGPLYMGLSREEVLKRARLALEEVGMTGLDERLPHHLSLGQKKRIAIATVLSMSPTILALDEPFSSLDPSARRELMNLLQTLPQTMIVSTHHIPLIRHLFPRTVVMDDGCIVADGDTEAILADTALLETHGLEVS
ncbi:MAG: cobalt ABC transporter ATP-binding protein [Dehalococcoidia bacterium SM23_28_2]|nr:MAG: cobalt ABC transporter ATP-binding protein [Dehalococcoidia bacterium SM23_28_2]